MVDLRKLITPKPGREVKRMAENLKKIECDPMCGFMVRSHDEKELIEIAKQHVEKVHKMEASEEELREKIKPA